MRVGIIGAGPAGTVFALALLRGAQQRGQKHDVLLFDGKSFDRAGPQGCNMCAGVIPTTLLDYLGPLNDKTIRSIVQRIVGGHFFETPVGGIQIPKEPGVTLCTVFRSGGPRGDAPNAAQSFDNLILNTALSMGAQHIPAHVSDVAMPESKDSPFRITATDQHTYDVDVLIGAFGVNSAISKRFETLGFGYKRPKTYHVCQAELPLDPDFIENSFHNEIKIFSLAMRDIRYGALTPKGHHVTASVIGEHVKRADLERFLQHPSVLKHFPPGWKIPENYCHCHPQLPISAARNVVADRVIMIGDANIGRYLKGGIESAFFTGSLAAEMILQGRMTRRELLQGYVCPTHARYYRDNAWGRFLFRCNDLISRSRLISNIGLWLLKKEEMMPEWSERPHTQLLWQIFTGEVPYRKIALDAISFHSLGIILKILVSKNKMINQNESMETQIHRAPPRPGLGEGSRGVRAELEDGQSIAIIGGGPGGMACAMALKREAEKRSQRINVMVFEGKHFNVDYNQCSGVLSPPLLTILKDEFDITLPSSLHLREIQGYALHTEHNSLQLNGNEFGGVSLAVRRSQFDEFMANCARERGVTIIPTRVTDLEFRRDEVMVFTWQRTFQAAAVVGAFGLSRAMTATLSHHSAYRPPRALETLVTKVHPDGHTRKDIPNLLDNYIHVFLPSLPNVEFGALIPKGNHVTVIIAGDRLCTSHMDAFLALPAVRQMISGPLQPDNYFKGSFPISIARGMFGDRYVTVGDAAGLVRPFKGKGINSAIITGNLAAKTIMEKGVSAEAFKTFYDGCREITGDVFYGNIMRKLAWITSHHFSIDPILKIAEKDPTLQELLFDCVSGRESYRKIMLRPGNLKLAIRLGLASAFGLNG